MALGARLTHCPQHEGRDDWALVARRVQEVLDVLSFMQPAAIEVATRMRASVNE